MPSSTPIDSATNTSHVFLVPPAVTNLQVVRVTMTAARISWEAPNLEGCDSFKGYQIYLSKCEDDKKMRILLSLVSDDVEHECVSECVVTLSSLSASTTYQIDVCAVTNKGKGPRATIHLVTASAGKFQIGERTTAICLCFPSRRCTSSSTNVFGYRPPRDPCQMASARSDFRPSDTLRIVLQWSMCLYGHRSRIPCHHVEIRYRIFDGSNCHHQRRTFS